MEDGSGSTVIGPLYDWHEKEDSRLQVAVSGPFDSTSAFLQEILIASSNKNIRDKAEAKVLEAIVDCLPALDFLFHVSPILTRGMSWWMTKVLSPDLLTGTSPRQCHDLWDMPDTPGRSRAIGIL